MKISELKTGDGKVIVEGVVAEKGEVRDINTKYGQTQVCETVLEDDSGVITLVLWGDQIKDVQEGDRVRVENGYVKEWNNSMQLNVGKFGTIKVLK
ncbi:MAG: DNA-binding protein [Candidatus Aenigmarchaeota archaeon]|nr:DNA-binding protein [Candidatus Aenigmarchaeota archaeon]